MTSLGKHCWVLLFFATTVIASAGQSFETLASFDAGYPQWASLVQGSDAAFYGTTRVGAIVSARYSQSALRVR